jgi:hypothetical protein
MRKMSSGLWGSHTTGDPAVWTIRAPPCRHASSNASAASVVRKARSNSHTNTWVASPARTRSNRSSHAPRTLVAY